MRRELEGCEDGTVITAKNFWLNVTIKKTTGHTNIGKDVVDSCSIICTPTVHLSVPAGEGKLSVRVKYSECVQELSVFDLNICCYLVTQISLSIMKAIKMEYLCLLNTDDVSICIL